MTKEKAFELQYAKYDAERKGRTPEEYGALAARASGKRKMIRAMHRTVKEIRELPEE
jgi:hypothetical protein